MSLRSKNAKHNILNRFQFLERVYILSSKDDDKPDFSKGFSCTHIGNSLGLDSKQSLDIADILTRKDLVKKMTMGNDDVKLRLTPRGSHIIEMIHDKKDPQTSNRTLSSITTPTRKARKPFSGKNLFEESFQSLREKHEQRLILGIILSAFLLFALLFLLF